MAKRPLAAAKVLAMAKVLVAAKDPHAAARKVGPASSSPCRSHCSHHGNVVFLFHFVFLLFRRLVHLTNEDLISVRKGPFMFVGQRKNHTVPYAQCPYDKIVSSITHIIVGILKTRYRMTRHFCYVGRHVLINASVLLLVLRHFYYVGRHVLVSASALLLVLRHFCYVGSHVLINASASY